MLSQLHLPNAGADGFRPPSTMTPDEFGDTVARQVWESFSDYLADGDTEASFRDLGIAVDAELPPGHLAEEALIFLLWAHTRAAQLAFVGRAPQELLREGLDALHAAIFHDMVEHGTPPGQLPLFEEHVSARYAEYNQAVGVSDTELSRVALRHLSGGESDRPEQATALLGRALAVTHPLRDFLHEVELVEG